LIDLKLNSKGYIMVASSQSLYITKQVFNAFATIAFLVCCIGSAQDQAPSVTIAEEPKYIDPIAWVPEALRTKATHSFQEVPLGEVAEWIQSQTGLSVVLDERALEEKEISPSELLTESLKEVPIYQFLDRLERIGVDWTSDGRMITLLPLNSSIRNVQYNIGDLLDMEYKPGNLISVLTSTIDEGSWLDYGGTSTAVLLGDVLFIRQTSRTHRKIAALLEGLRHPARKTWVDESKEHESIRATLDAKTSVQLKGTPLAQAVQSISAQHQLNIRLDRLALRRARISERLPISVDIREQNLGTILQFITSQYELGWFYRDGVVWITHADDARAERKIAIFDVRDLCKTSSDCSKLQQAIEGQADPGHWEREGGTGIINFPSTGIMVISQRESVIDEVSTLLDNYRSALKNSKRRMSAEVDPEVFETKYYRLPSAVANDLRMLLPKLIEPTSWIESESAIEGAKGTIQICRSVSVPLKASAELMNKTAFEDYSVLIIHQKRRVHPQITELLQKIERGDAPGFGGAEGFGGGMGGSGSGIGGMGGMGGMF
jgi:hypothetical protein